MTPGNHYFKKNCRICDSLDLEKVVELTPTPPGNNFIRVKDLGVVNEEEFPLELYFCTSCKHIQLGHVVDPSFLFQSGYSYVSSTSEVFVNHLEDYSNHLESLLNPAKDSFIVDIGSNDGTCLSFFKRKGLRVLGIDPATEIAAIAKSKHMELADFYTQYIRYVGNKLSLTERFINNEYLCCFFDEL